VTAHLLMATNALRGSLIQHLASFRAPRDGIASLQRLGRLDASPYVGHRILVRKTSVYLTEDEAEGLRRLAVREGRAQAELIREGVRRVIADAGDTPRRFRSLGVGGSGGPKAGHWSSEALYRKTRGER
jgi:hypothetical protein